jgi:A/G-specific adenine glycosylase
VSAIPRNGAGFAGKLIAWQRRHGRHDLPWQGTRDPYRIWVSEIMLQQTQVGAVIGYFERFMDRFPDVFSLAGASEGDVLKLWSGLGYYARARNLHKAAHRILEAHGGRFPRTAAEIALLPGVGRSTAAAIAAFAFGERGPILDGNVKRVLARRFGIEGFPGSAKVESTLWELAGILLPRGDIGTQIESYTQGLMDLGATVCTRNHPACGDCPISAGCVALKTHRTKELPAPRPRKEYQTRNTRWLVLRYREQVLLEQRPSSGIWGGLWAFPELEGGDPAPECLARFGCELSGHRELPSFAHGFTHFRLQILPIVCDVGTLSPRIEAAGRLWLDPEEAVTAAVPTPVRKVLRTL